MSALRQGWKQSPLRFLITTTQNRMSRSKSADDIIDIEPTGSNVEVDRLSTSSDEETDLPGVITRGREQARQHRLVDDDPHVVINSATHTHHLRP